MKRLALITGSVLVVLIVIVVGVFVFVLANLDDIIEAAVEDRGGEITGAGVTLDAATVSPESGAGALRGLTLPIPRASAATTCCDWTKSACSSIPVRCLTTWSW